jgi:hypothetical protein
MLAAESRQCGTAVNDAAYVLDSDQNARACLAVPPRPERLTEVVLQPWLLPDAFAAPPPGTRVLGDGRTQLAARIPDRDVRLIVTSPDPDRARRLFDGVRVVSDPDGCAVRDTRNRPDLVTRSPGPMVPAGVHGGSVCGYRDGWLAGSHTLAADEAAELGAAFNTAPEGLAVVSGAGCPDTAGPQEKTRGPHWLIQFQGDRGHTDVWVYGEACLPSGAVSGAGLPSG